jgi:hypothetical protein
LALIVAHQHRGGLDPALARNMGHDFGGGLATVDPRAASGLAYWKYTLG